MKPNDKRWQASDAVLFCFLHLIPTDPIMTALFSARTARLCLLSLLAFATLQTGCKKAPDDTVNPNNNTSGTVINADITADRTLTDLGAGVDYVIKGTISVTNNAKLTINPGVTVAFDQDASLTIESGSSLAAVGTASNGILFTATSAVNGFWKGLHFESISSSNVMDNCTVEYGGQAADSDGANIVLGDHYNSTKGSLRLTNSVLRKGGRAGVFASSNSTLPVFTNNKINGNTGEAMIVSINSSDAPDPTNDYTGNGRNYVLIKGTSSSSDNSMVHNIEWKALNIPYSIQDVVVIQMTLTVDAGVTVIAQNSGTMYVNGEDSGTAGKVYCNGTAANRVTFTGDTQPASWGGFDIHCGTLNATYTSFLYGDAISWKSHSVHSIIMANSYYSQIARISLQYCEIGNAYAYGLAYSTDTGGAQSACTYSGIGNNFHNNASGNIYTNF